MVQFLFSFHPLNLLHCCKFSQLYSFNSSSEDKPILCNDLFKVFCIFNPFNAEGICIRTRVLVSQRGGHIYMQLLSDNVLCMSVAIEEAIDL